MRTLNDDPGIKMEETCGACPQQYQGTVDGNPAYFRLRHSLWRFCIIQPGGNPIGPGMTPHKKVLYYNEGELPGSDVGVMEDCEEFIMFMIRDFRAGRKEGMPMDERVYSPHQEAKFMLMNAMALILEAKSIEASKTIAAEALVCIDRPKDFYTESVKDQLKNVGGN